MIIVIELQVTKKLGMQHSITYYFFYGDLFCNWVAN